MKGFGFGLMLGPIVIAMLAFWQANAHNKVIAESRDARATILNAHILTPKGAAQNDTRSAQYMLDLNWRDDKGQEQRAENVPIPRRLGTRLVDGDELIQTSVRIRYDVQKPDRVVMIEPQQPSLRLRNPVDEAVVASGHGWFLAILGGILFYLGIKRDEPAVM
jgi:hypothetical protein